MNNNQQMTSEDIQRQILETIKLIAKDEAEKAVKEAIKNININKLLMKDMNINGYKKIL